MKQAVFLDRDGVITQEPPYHAHKLNQLKLIPRAADAIRRLNENSFTVIIVSNQAGIARGYYKEEDTTLFNQALIGKLAGDGAYINAIYYCPHHPDAVIDELRVDCDCRKPRPGLLLKAKEELNIDLNQSFMVGDKLSDIEAGKRAGCKTILVRMGQGTEQLKSYKVDCDHVARDLYDATEYILSIFCKQRRGLSGYK